MIVAMRSSDVCGQRIHRLRPGSGGHETWPAPEFPTSIGLRDSIGSNDIPTHIPQVALGGWKQGGYGTERGRTILEPYQTTKIVSPR